MKIRPLLSLAISLAALAILTGCSSSPTSSGVGQLRISLIDSPVAYDQVNIKVSKVEVHAIGSDSLSGWTVVKSDTATYDLLTLQNGANAILGDKMLPIGKYTQIRLTIDAGSNVVVGGVPYPLDIAGVNIVKLNHNFTIEADKLYELTLDFDADKSIDQVSSSLYQLHPVIRVVANVVSGTISGTVSPSSARASVSAIAGADTVTTSCDTTSGNFMLMALPAGSYNVLVSPSDGVHRDTTITGVVVAAQANTSLGTIAVPVI